MTTFQQFTDSLLAGAWLIPLLTAVAQLIKVTFPKMKRFISLIVAVIGIGTGLAIIEVSFLGAVIGLAFGLAATGLYEVGSTAIKGK